MSVSFSERRSAALSVVVLAATIGLQAGAAFLGFSLPESAPPEAHDPGRVALISIVLATGFVGAFLIWRAPRNRISWILGAIAILTGFSSFVDFYQAQAIYGPVSPPLAVPVTLVGQFLWPPTVWLLAVFLPLSFPDGRVLSPRWRVLACAGLAAVLTGAACELLDPAAMTIGGRALKNPLGMPGAKAVVRPVLAVAGVVFFGSVVGALASLGIRFHRGNSEQRQQLKWFIAGFLVFVVSLASSVFISRTSVIVGIGTAMAATALPVAVAVAVLKYRLYDIDVVISRTLVYVALAVFITAVYVGIVVGIGSLVGSGGRPNLALSIVATAIVAVAFQPARERLQKVANRLVYGLRATPYEVLSQFSERVAESYAADDVLPRMARVLAEGTGAARADVWLRAGDILRQGASWPDNSTAAEVARVLSDSLPDMPDTDRAIEVRHQGALLGALTVTKRKGESLTPVEDKLLMDLAGQAGLVLRNVGLTAELMARLDDLRTSRQRLVAAQDEERRRLERNLHDGAQQNLVALKVKLALAEMFAEKDPARAKATLAELKVDTDEALETLRDLARGIYPPLLADKGLAAALESQVRKATLPVQVMADGVGRYPQEVEAAVYFCCLEALQNVQKYAAAQNAGVKLEGSDGGLSFEVTDDGHGFDIASVKRGAGLTNITDRVDALGGRLELSSTPGGGTKIHGSLPALAAAALA
jgi:signal transduction histidine kinase